MTNTVQDRVKTEWEKAQELGGQRVSRIREILGAAAAEALSEIKEGSGEIEAQGRKTLADMIEQLKAKEAAEAAAAEAEANAEFLTEEDIAAPSWGDIFAELGHLANDRKVEWAQSLLAKLHDQLDRFDADMATEYGNGYNLFRPLVNGFRSLVALAAGKLGQSTEPPAPAPVSIEVLDEADTAEGEDA